MLCFATRCCIFALQHSLHAFALLRAADLLLVEAQCDAVAQPRYTFTIGPAAQHDVEIRLRHICFRLAARA